MNHLLFTKDKINIGALTEIASHDSCGAISLFVGTTRDNFDNKNVTKLEYEAHESMALKELGKIAEEIRKQWPDIKNIVIAHRLGEVLVKEASIVIAISSPHRKEAIKATEWCIDTIKKSVTIWKKEVYADDTQEWKENKESSDSAPKSKKLKVQEPEVEVPYVAPHLVQIKASNEEINRRIDTFMERKRNEINVRNVREFCNSDRTSEFICARVDATLQKRKDSKGHLQVSRVLNTYHRDQMNSDYLMKYIPRNGIEERLENLELQLSLYKPIPRNIYTRLKNLEDRLILLESISPEYINFWDKNNLPGKLVKKRVFSLQEIDAYIGDLEQKINDEKR